MGVTVSEEPLGHWQQEGCSGGKMELCPQYKCFPGDPMALGGLGGSGSYIELVGTGSTAGSSGGVRGLRGARDEGDGAYS